MLVESGREIEYYSMHYEYCSGKYNIILGKCWPRLRENHGINSDIIILISDFIIIIVSNKMVLHFKIQYNR